MMSLIPLPYRIGLLGLICGALYVFGMMHGESVVKRKWDAQNAATQAARAVAVDARIADNAKTAADQRDINLAIKKAKNEDLAPVVAAIAADRLRIGPALCPGRFTAASEAPSVSRSDGPDNVASGVSQAAERDFKALELEVAKSLASGRAAQKFITDNGLAP